MMKRLLLTTVAILIMALLFVSCGDDQTSQDNTNTSAQAKINDNQATPPDAVPDGGGTDNVAATGSISSQFVFTATDIDGNQHTSDEWIGKGPVVVNVWGTWCGPCRKEVPDLVKLYEEFKPQGIEILGFAVRDTPDKVRNFSTSNNMNWVMMMGDQNSIETFGSIRGVPTTIFIDKDGKELGRFVGARSYKEFKEAFEAIL